MKIITMFLLICLVFGLIGCSTYIQPSLTNEVDTITSVTPNTSVDTNTSEPPVYDFNISVNSIDELKKMREMVGCTDDEELNEYLKTVNASSVDDLIEFIDIVDNIPYIKVFDGDISWISRIKGSSQDTGEVSDVLFISTTNTKGEWIRLEYILSAEDADGEIQKQLQNVPKENVFEKSVTASDGKITVFSQTTKAHPSGTGDVITWISTVDSIFVRIVYYTVDAEAVNVNSIFSKALISNIE